MARSKRTRSEVLVSLVTNNYGLKAIALGLSIALFSLVHSDVDAQRSILVDVVALLPPPDAGKILISELPAQVKVTLRGSRSRISNLSRDEIPPIQIDLREGAAGYHYFDTDEVEVGGNVQVVEITPSNLPLTWARSAERTVPVEVVLDGELDGGLSLVQAPEVQPSRMTLHGPEPSITRIAAVQTEGILLDELVAGTHTRRVPLQPLPEYVSYLEDVSVTVTLRVEPLVGERTLRRLDVAAIGEGSASLRPAYVSVTVAGPQEQLDRLDIGEVVPYVNLDPEQGTGTLPHEVSVRGLPDGLEVVRITPATVLVRRKGGSQ